jgi:hypothetical protein
MKHSLKNQAVIGIPEIAVFLDNVDCVVSAGALTQPPS